MNSFSGVRKALEYEIPRQIQVLKGGGKLVQSTRRWNDVTQLATVFGFSIACDVL